VVVCLPLCGVNGVKDMPVLPAVTGVRLCLGVMTLLRAFLTIVSWDYALSAGAAVHQGVKTLEE